VKKDILRQLPSIDELMNTDELTRLAELHDRDVIVNAARAVVDDVRSEIAKQDDDATVQKEGLLKQITYRIISRVENKFAPSLRHAINASGIVLHTGLGRAVLSQAAIDAVNDVIRSYCTLATDIETGQRSTRDIHFSDILCELTGAEAATITGNNAAATMLILNTLAKGKEVIVSRGQLVEIGGAFRMPEVMETSGAIMREVGTTNKTHLRDYIAAINENTGAILRVHQSNYRIVGFTEEPSITELAPLAKEHGIPLIDDLGSGALVELTQYGVEPEPMVQTSIKAGVDVACFSGDKLIGGPQCGIIVGNATVIKQIKKNPLARALRVGKMEVAALEATLKLFLDREKLNKQHPTYRMLSLTTEEIEPRVRAMADALKDIANIDVIDGQSQVGSGSVPAETMPTKLLSVRPSTMTADTLSKKLRYYTTPIFARIHQEAVLFDPRTIHPNEDKTVVQALRNILMKETEVK
jgi:L-seryl-tRNA(Ser) seleniumtransferase